MAGNYWKMRWNPLNYFLMSTKSLSFSPVNRGTLACALVDRLSKKILNLNFFCIYKNKENLEKGFVNISKKIPKHYLHFLGNMSGGDDENKGMSDMLI